MGLFKKLSGLFSPSPQTNQWEDWITVRCNKCGEVIRTRVNLRNDLSEDYIDGVKKYFTRKTIIGSNRCYAPVEVELTYNAEHKRIDQQIHGGAFVDGSQED
jgi:hypothetical protein